MVDQHAGEMRSRYDTLYAAFVGLPATLRDSASRGCASRTAGRRWSPSSATSSRCWRPAFLAERIYVYALRRYRQRLLHGTGDGLFGAGVPGRHGARARPRRLAVFGIAAILFFFSWWLDHDLRRILVLQMLFIVFVVRVVALLRDSCSAAAPSTSACCHSTTGQRPPARLCHRVGRHLRREHCDAIAAERRGGDAGGRRP